MHHHLAVELAHPFGCHDRARELVRSFAQAGERSIREIGWAIRHDIALPLYHNCLEVDDGLLFEGVLQPLRDFALAETPTEVYCSEIAAVARALNEAQLPYVFVKGAALLALVPHYRHRQMTDLDIIVPDCRSLWGVAQELQKMGYTLDADKDAHFLRDSGGALAGKLALTRDIRGRKIGIDVHTEELAVGAAIRIPWSVCGDIRRTTISGVAVAVPSLEAWFLYSIAHRLVHACISQRDVADYYAFLKEFSSSVDWPRINELLSGAGLLDFAGEIISMTRARYRDLPTIPLQRAMGVTSAVFRLANERRILGIPRTLEFFVWRPLVYATYTLQYLRAASCLGKAFSDCGRQVWFCWRRGFLGMEWPVWMNKMVKLFIKNRPPLSKISRDHTFMVRLADAPNHTAGRHIRAVEYPGDDVAVLSDGSATLVVTPLGTYAISTDLVYTKEQWERTLSLLRAVLDIA